MTQRLRDFFASRATRASLLCVFLRHADALHEVTEHGSCWVCPSCRRWRRGVL